MTPELTVLTLAALWQVVQFALMSIPANRELGTSKTLSPRDFGNLEEQVSANTARMIRAFNNHFESLALFTIAVVVIVLSEQSTPFTAACAWVYLGARILYVPAYVLGWVPWRSTIWFVGFAAIVAMLIAALI